MGVKPFIYKQAAAWLIAAATLWTAAASADDRVLYSTSFEETQPKPNIKDYTLTDRRSRTGKRSLTGAVDKPNTGCILRVPFEASKGKLLVVSYWILGQRGTAATMFVRTGKGLKNRTRIGKTESPAMNKWRQVTGMYRVGDNTRGVVEIVAPAGWSGKPGRIWIDDLAITETKAPPAPPEIVEDFPSIACDAQGVVWLAILERPLPGRRISVYRVEGDKRVKVCSIAPPGLTGLGAPSVAALRSGCVVTFPVEQNDRWRIAAARVGLKTAKPSIRRLDGGGNANISPAAVTVGDRVWVLWVSNGGKTRSINACWMSHDAMGKPHQISNTKSNSYNPAVVAQADGTLFAAWDSIRNSSADIYGAEYRNGRWSTERRLTSGARIERHPALAAFKGQVWMAWQAQSYKAIKLNAPQDQRVIVARIDGKKLLAPLGLFKKVSTPRVKLLRPEICFDGKGRLWLLARRSGGQHAGWLPTAWCYSDKQWTGPLSLMRQQGRWRPIAAVDTPRGPVAAVQFDNINARQGVGEDWRSGVVAIALPTKSPSAGGPLQTEPLKTPETDFSLAERVALINADFPRQTWKHNSDELKLYWGDFHDHTDLSSCARAVNPPGHDLFANVRDIERLDFAALTDHGYNLDRPQWAYNGEQTRANHDPGRFVAFLGQEWTSKKNPPADGATVGPKTPLRYGHRNLIFLDPHHKRFYDAMDGDINPRQLWDQLQASGAEFITIPHQLADWQHKGRGNPPTDWSFTHEHLQPVAEIFQARQSYEYLGCPRQSPSGAPFARYYLHDAWAKGIIIGVIASPDHGGGSGKVGVWAKDLTRKAILQAVRDRHCYGTSGAKMAMQFSSGSAMMGDKVKRPEGQIAFHVKALAAREIRELVIFRNNRIVRTVKPNKKQIELDWTDKNPPDEKLLWYYARIQAVDEELAWTSPIWFVKHPPKKTRGTD
ncbi:MAG: DUF3604 domain-containing protein [Phycisphaerae bacterium]|jgi:hypothetical protein|nr:DUF3604 domain-containing protein [Phycisphaerae bacterium]